MQGEELQPLANGRYRLEEPLGMGGMATVYRAMDGALQVERAIKILSKELTAHPKLRTRFITEARTMARLRHPNVVTVYDVSLDETRPFIVMEMIEGGSLGDRIQKEGRLELKQACILVEGALRGVQAAHDQGVVHRDLKPDNILLTVEGVPKVTDFGIAHVEDLGMALTRTGTVMGTLAYMAPEQRSSARDADARSDIFAMGATLYVAVTGKEPFDIYATNVQDELLHGIPEAIEEIIRKACQYRADDRYSTANEMADALIAAQVGLGDGLIVQDVVGIDAGSHDSKETISLGDLGSDDDDLLGMLTSNEEEGTPSETPQESPAPAAPPSNLGEPSFLMDSPSIPEPAPRSNRLVVLVLALGAGIGLAGGSIYLLQGSGDSSESSAPTESTSGSTAKATETAPEETMPKAEEEEASSADPSTGAAVKPEQEASPPSTEETKVPAQASVKETPAKTVKKTKQTKNKVAETPPVQQAVTPTEEAVDQAVEPEVIVKEEEPPPVVVGGTLNIRATPAGTIYLDNVRMNGNPTGAQSVKKSTAGVRVVDESGAEIRHTVRFDGGETISLVCSFGNDSCVSRVSR